MMLETHLLVKLQELWLMKDKMTTQMECILLLFTNGYSIFVGWVNEYLKH